MDLALRQVGDALVVGFPSRVDLEGATSTVFKDELKRLVGEGWRHMVVDLSEVGFIDSQGLGALISCLKVLRQVDGVLVLARLSEPAAAVLRITRLERVFEVHDSIEGALRALDLRSAAEAAARGAT